jgi:hypothetical protein
LVFSCSPSPRGNLADRRLALEITTGRADYYDAGHHEAASKFFGQVCLWPKCSALRGDGQIMRDEDDGDKRISSAERARDGISASRRKK